MKKYFEYPLKLLIDFLGGGVYDNQVPRDPVSAREPVNLQPGCLEVGFSKT